MGFLDKLTDRITKRAEDNAVRSVDRAVDKSMDTKNIQNKAEDHKAKKEEKKAAEEERKAAENAGSLSDRKKCPSCSYVTKENFCGKCGANLSGIECMTEAEFEEHING